MVDLYAGQASIFDRFSGDSFAWKHIERPALDTTVAPLITPFTKILDAGCGSGRIIRYLAEKGASPHRIVGVDSSRSMLEIARHKFETLDLRHEDIAMGWSVRSNFFHLVISVHVFPHLDSVQLLSALKNFYRALEPGGTLVILVGHPARYLCALEGHKHYNLAWCSQPTPWGAIIDHYYRTEDDYLAAVRQAGFKLELVETLVPVSGREDPINFAWYSKLPARLMLKAAKPRTSGDVSGPQQERRLRSRFFCSFMPSAS